MRKLNKRRLLAAAMTLLLVWTLAACSAKPNMESDTSEPPQLPISGISAANYPDIDGSTACIPLLARIYSEVCGVSKEEAEARVNVSGGTGAVWRQVLSGGCELAIAYEAPAFMREEEYYDFNSVEITPYGRDALVFIVNKNNPIDNLTIEQLIGIYTGQITDWSEVGGNPGPIAAYQRNIESGSQTLFLKLLMGDIEPMEAPTELVPAMMGGLIDAVADYNGAGGAIGFSVYFYAQAMYENPDLKIISVDGTAPSIETIENGSYSLTNDFYLVLNSGESSGSPARRLRNWLLTEEGLALLREEGYACAL